MNKILTSTALAAILVGASTSVATTNPSNRSSNVSGKPNLCVVALRSDQSTSLESLLSKSKKLTEFLNQSDIPAEIAALFTRSKISKFTFPQHSYVNRTEMLRTAEVVIGRDSNDVVKALLIEPVVELKESRVFNTSANFRAVLDNVTLSDLETESAHLEASSLLRSIEFLRSVGSTRIVRAQVHKTDSWTGKPLATISDEILIGIDSSEVVRGFVSTNSSRDDYGPRLLMATAIPESLAPKTIAW
ncbi:MAG: hypothetical protein V4692_04975 [Bdellovibrionota bacterium]